MLHVAPWYQHREWKKWYNAKQFFMEMSDISGFALPFVLWERRETIRTSYVTQSHRLFSFPTRVYTFFLKELKFISPWSKSWEFFYAATYESSLSSQLIFPYPLIIHCQWDASWRVHLLAEHIPWVELIQHVQCTSYKLCICDDKKVINSLFRHSWKKSLAEVPTYHHYTLHNYVTTTAKVRTTCGWMRVRELRWMMVEWKSFS